MSREGRRSQGRHCWIRHVAVEPTLGSAMSPRDPYVGYAIGRSVGNAVVRNRIRRRLRAIVARAEPTMGPGLYLIGVTGRGAATVDHDELRTDVRSTLERAQQSPRATG